MNEFNATVIVNSLTHQKIEVWRKYSYDDRSLQKYVESNKITLHCMEIIQQEIPEREQFELSYPDLVFEESLTVDLGNKVCILERIRSTHTDDSTIVYVPDDKIIFLGDSVYGTNTDAIFHYKASQLRPMIEDIQKYDANHFLLGHESICDLDEMNVFWDQLTSCNRAVNSTSLDHAIECFEQNNLRSPQGDELFFLKAFVNHQILISK